MPTFATPPDTDPVIIESKARARRILIEALKQADIPESVANEYQSLYWHSVKIGDSNEIEVRITTHGWGTGWTTLLLFPQGLAERTVETRSDDEEATSALADALSYIKFTVSQILGHTSQLLSLRGINEYCQRYPDYGDALRDAHSLLGEPVMRAYEKARKDMERRLAAEPITTRGGSDPKLSEDELKQLHVQYDVFRKIGRKIKKDYNKELKRFARERSSRGYSHKQWRARWKTYCAEHYPNELREFAMLFAHPDGPSASAVAYQKIAQLTRHSVSYVPGLVTKSRKLKKSNNE